MSLYIKIREYFIINKIIRGLLIAISASIAIYLDYLFNIVNPFINTIFGLLTIYYILKSDSKVWFWSGFFIGIFWFWWISLSFKNYGFLWAMPIGILFTALSYGVLFLIFAKISEIYKNRVYNLIIKTSALLIFSYIHPFGFDWFKMELIFTNSYIGILKWQFLIVLFATSLAIYKENLLLLTLIVFAFPFNNYYNKTPLPNREIELTNFHITVEDKWNLKLQKRHIDMALNRIEEAIDKREKIVVLPESIFALFLNRSPKLMTILEALSNEITIITGGLYLDRDNNPKNTAYIFQNGEFKIASKAVLVPFGEYNPLPDWLGKIVNRVFFDGAPDYTASLKITKYIIDGVEYTNAICYEGTSEKIYRDSPKNIILISNNGWVVPSIEPTLQKIILQYYSKKYGTTIYHSANMSPSYIVHNGYIYGIE